LNTAGQGPRCNSLRHFRTALRRNAGSGRHCRAGRAAAAFPGKFAFCLLGFPDSDTNLLKQLSLNRVLLTYGRLSDEVQVQTDKDVVAMWKYVEDCVADGAIR